MTEEKDFWINKDEVGILNGVEGTEYKVTQETMNQKGWYKLADDEQVVKKAELTKEEAEWFEKYKNLPYFDGDSDDYFSQKVFDKMMEYREGFEDWEDFKDWKKPNGFHNRLSQAYFTGYTVKKEPKYYIKFPTWQTYGEKPYLNVDKDDGTWELETKKQGGSFQTQFTQKEIYELQKDERAKGIDFNTLKVKVPDDELAD